MYKCIIVKDEIISAKLSKKNVQKTDFSKVIDEFSSEKEAKNKVILETYKDSFFKRINLL